MTQRCLRTGREQFMRLLEQRLVSLLLLMGMCLSFSNVVQAQNSIAAIESYQVIGIDMGSHPQILNVKSMRPASRQAFVDVHYSYDGSKGTAFLAARSRLDSDMGNIGPLRGTPIESGRNMTQRIEITKPDSAGKMRTNSIEIMIYTRDNSTQEIKKLSSKTLDWLIEWPEPSNRTDSISQRSEASRQKLLHEAIIIIDNDASGKAEYDSAKGNLDTVIKEDPKNAQAYLELARIVMKGDYAASESNAYAGLDEAERLIKVALRIDPSYANSYVLFGYVMAVQKRTDEAIIAFKKAQQIGTDNMWLYYNWGLALENANRNDEAIKKYQEGTTLKPAFETAMQRSNNRAIPMIYRNQMRLLEKRKDYAAMDILYQKRLAALDETCQIAAYAKFKLYKMGDYESAIQKGTQAQERNCRAGARELLAAAYLTKWALDPSKISQKEREVFLDRGQAFISNTQETIVDLASSEFTAKVLPKLKDAGIKLDGLDAKGMTPLTYAAAKGDKDAVKSLIAAGANADTVLQEGWTPLMIAVMSGHEDVVRVLLDAKVNVNLKTRDGQSAMSMARHLGNSKIVALLNGKTQFR